MAFPYIFESNFEAGSNAEWDSEADTDSILDFPHYSALASIGRTPYSGAYCLRIVPAGGTNDATLTEGDMNIVDTATGWFRFNLFISSNFDATANDTAALFELQGAANAVTVSFGFRYVASTDVINLGIGGAAAAAAPATFSAVDLERDKWHTVELKAVIQTGGTGTVDLYVTPEGGPQATTAQASVTTITNIAVTHGVLGLQDHLATTTGTILIDNFVMDDGQIYTNPRWPRQIYMTKSGHAFVGNGKIDQVTLIGGNADNRLYVYDSDIAANDVAANMVGSLIPTAVATVNTNGPIQVKHGAYIALSGTNPQAIIDVGYGGAYGSNAVLVNYGRRR